MPCSLRTGKIADYYAELGISQEREATGFFLNDQGVILAPLDVLLSALSLSVRTWDGATYQAEIMAVDVGTNLAVLKIPLSGTRPIQWGDSASLSLGEHLLLVGTDSEMNGRVTRGIVSSRERSLQAMDEGFFARTFFVDSGSPVQRSGWLAVNLEGQAVGMLAQQSARVYEGQGEDVVVSASQLKKVSEQLAQGKAIERSYLGVHVQAVTAEWARIHGLKTSGGALVADVLEGGPAEQAGVRPGDVITQVAEQKIINPAQFRLVAGSSPVGKLLNIQLLRGAQSMELGLRPTSHPSQLLSQSSEIMPSQGASVRGARSPLDGLNVVELAAPTRRLDLSTPSTPSVLISGIDYRVVMASTLIEPGVELLEINGRAVPSVKEFEALRQSLQNQSMVSLRVNQGGVKRFLTLKLIP
ncbi:MAG: PDZ domain-containing protein [Blastochloris sp.]|nr:PDZ domain-containing protein [Blastochloris sp.]